MLVLNSLYEETILEHGLRPLHFALPADLTSKRELSNRSCGDLLTLGIAMSDNTIADIGFTGSGCAISTASTSLMSDIVNGYTTEQAIQLAVAVRHFISKGEAVPHPRLAPFHGVTSHLNRHNCALLAWNGLKALVEEASTKQPEIQTQEKLKERIITELRAVFDPEVPVNIYDLGFIYNIQVGNNGTVAIVMTLTTPHCPVAESLPREVERRIVALPGVTSVIVTLTFDPPWSKEKMSQDARLFLGM